MEHVNLLDCTLRDGAYLIDKKFGDNTIRGIIDGLVKANIEYIEVGFFQNEGFGEGKTVFGNSEDVKKFIPINKGNSQFTVLADYSRYSVERLDERRDDSIDAIRECFFKHERFEALKACKVIKERGYKLFIQPVDILGYTDLELIELLNLVNEVEPYCFSIVDTFGSMYQEDLHRLFELVNYNLIRTCKIGFHSHNNMQLSNALSQEFIRLSAGKREVVVDSTISGMGRGAGNTPTELIAQYMFSRLGYSYDIDAILDVIDTYMDNIRCRCNWGYSTPYFVAGCYSAHINNISYLSKKNSIRSKDIRYILNKIGLVDRKRYDYGLLEKTYIELVQSDIDDSKTLEELKECIGNRKVLVLVPGSSAIDKIELIQKSIHDNNPVIISVNFIHETIKADFVYINNIKRYRYWQNSDKFIEAQKILTSNIVQNASDDKEKIVSFIKLVKCGWEYLDNSTIMLLRLLDALQVNEIYIAGFDGYDVTSENYVSNDLELSSARLDALKVNREIYDMLNDYRATRYNTESNIIFVTPSRFEDCFK